MFTSALEKLEGNNFKETSLDLSQCDLGMAGLLQLSAAAQKHPNQTIQFLNLSNNQISRLPKNVFSGFLALKKLTLNNNLISHIAVGAFETEAGHLLGIEELSLINNPLKKVFDEITKLQSLLTLLLHDTGIAEIPLEIYNLKKLQTLGLKQNNFSSFPAFGEHLLSLKKLCFDGLPSKSSVVETLFFNTLFEFSQNPSNTLLKGCILLLEARINKLRAVDLETINFDKINEFLKNKNYKEQRAVQFLSDLFYQNNIPVAWVDNQFVVSKIEKDFIKLGSQLGLSEERDPFGGVWYGRDNNFSVNTWGGKITDGINWVFERMEQFVKVLDDQKEIKDSEMFQFFAKSFGETVSFCNKKSNNLMPSQKNFYKKLLFNEGALVVLPAGSIGHAVGLAMLKHAGDAFLVFCDRDSHDKFNVYIYQIKNVTAKEAAMSEVISLCVQQYLVGNVAAQRIHNQIKKLEPEVVFKGGLQKQNHGNCIFANPKGVVFPLILLYKCLQVPEPKINRETVDKVVKESLRSYKAFTTFVRKMSAEELVESHKNSKTIIEKQIKEKLAALQIVLTENKFLKKSSSFENSKLNSMILFREIFKSKKELLQAVPLSNSSRQLITSFLNKNG